MRRPTLGLVVLTLLLGSACQAPKVRRPTGTPRPTAAPPVDTLVAAPGLPVLPESTTVEEAWEFPTPAEPVLVQARLGVLAPFSGRFAAYGTSFLDGSQLALESNRVLETSGIEIVPADSKGDPIAGLGAVRRLIEGDEVLAIVGGVLNLTTLVAGVEANCRGVPLLSNLATEDGIGEIGPYVFHEVASRQREARAAAEMAVFQLRRFQAAVLYPDEADAQALASGFSQRITELGGQIIASEAYELGTKDFNSIVRRLQRAAPEVLYLPIGVEDMLLVAPTLGFQGIRAQLIGTESWQSQRLLRGSGVDLEGALLPAGVDVGSATDLAAFEVRYRERYGREGNRFAAAGFVATNWLLEVLAQNPEADREQLREALELHFGHTREDQVAVPFLIVREGEAIPLATP